MIIEKLSALKYLAALIIFSMTVIAAWIPFKRRINNVCHAEFPVGEAIASGVFLGVGLIHMLKSAASEFESLHFTYPWAYTIAGVSFLILLWLEHVSRELHLQQSKRPKQFAILAVIVLSIHALLAGSALGLTETTALAIMIFIAVAAHKWAESFALAVEVNRSLPLTSGLFYFMIFACMTPLGILLGNTINTVNHQATLLEGIFTAIAAGTFIYLGTLHGLKQAVLVEKCCDLKQFSYVIFGFTVMAIFAIWI